jgi:hypothetical protein
MQILYVKFILEPIVEIREWYVFIYINNNSINFLLINIRIVLCHFFTLHII